MAVLLVVMMVEWTAALMESKKVGMKADKLVAKLVGLLVSSMVGRLVERMVEMWVG